MVEKLAYCPQAKAFGWIIIAQERKIKHALMHSVDNEQKSACKSEFSGV